MRRNRVGALVKSLFTDGYVVSYPKCGRTWLTLMLGDLLAQSSPRRPLNPLRLKEYSSPFRRIPKIRIGHDDNPHEKPVWWIDKDKTFYRFSRTLFLYRDPRDVVVSLYFHECKRLGRDAGTLEEFTWSPRGGLPAIVGFYDIWVEAAARLGPRIHFLAYEDLRAAPEKHLAEAAQFLRIRVNTRDAVTNAVANNDFQRMQRRERAGLFPSARLRPGDAADSESYKTRRAIVGGYRDYFADTELAIINRYLDSWLPRFLADRYLTRDEEWVGARHEAGSNPSTRR